MRFKTFLIYLGLGIIAAAGAYWFQRMASTQMTSDLVNTPAIKTDLAENRERTVAAAPHAERKPSQEPALLSAQDRKRLAILDEISSTGNDNDSRLDSEFHGLNEASKKILQARYRELAPERLNARGTIVFLLGREIKTTEDLEFMGSVLSERPCLSLQSCAQPTAEGASTENLTSDAILVYPQIVAIRSLGKILSRQDDSHLHDLAAGLLHEAERSDNSKIAREARRASETPH